MGLFFLAVGMSVNVEEALDYWPYVLAGSWRCYRSKALVLYGIARLMGLPHYHRLLYALVLAQGGEFSFSDFQRGPGQSFDVAGAARPAGHRGGDFHGRGADRHPAAGALAGRYGGIGDMAVTPVGFAGSPPPQSAADNEERSGPG